MVPTVLDLHTHLVKMEEVLRQSLMRRFSGIFAKTDMTKDSGGEEPFGHNVYFLATMLDPQFGLNWVDLDVTNGQNATSVKNFREDLKKSPTGIHTYILHCEENAELAL